MLEFTYAPSTKLSATLSIPNSTHQEGQREPVAPASEGRMSARDPWTQIVRAWQDDAQVYGGAIDSPLFADV